MKPRSTHGYLLVVLAGAAIGLYIGWKTFWFLTDDAFIAFRYVNNSILGYGYAWNPPPFRPVEGYTSFLWVLILDRIWRISGLRPPEIANTLSLFFSYMTLLLSVAAVMRLKLRKSLAGMRLLLVVFVLLGAITNRTFLAWSSSGLETALFNLCLTLWVVLVLFGRFHRASWLFGISCAAALVYLSRPDGILVVLATAVLIVVRFLATEHGDHLPSWWLANVVPLLVVPLHLGWRQLTYGEWLPNTYYAKHVSAWPESGLKYLASFVLEYGLWFWILMLAFAVVVTMRRFWVESKHQSLRRGRWRAFVEMVANPPRSLVVVVVLTLIGHFGYYTFIIGGDHFEYRVYSHLVPFLFIAFVWMLNVVVARPAVAIVLCTVFLLVSYPIQWAHWALTKDLNTREETHLMRVPVSDSFPQSFRWYAQAFDHLQCWLIDHHVCLRHQEHKVFYEDISAYYPPRQPKDLVLDCEYPVMVASMVGVPGWVFPRVAIIDAYGLNDYVIARHSVPPGQKRLMAHDRSAPEGYLESFLPNVFMIGPNQPVIGKRETELTADMIRSLEAYWIDKTVRGMPINDLPPTQR